MSAPRRTFKREHPDARKAALIRATLDIIASCGAGAATVRAIADRAGISQGMIRHYFSTKEDLVAAAYETHMQALTDATAAADPAGGSAGDRLAAFVEAALAPPVMDPGAMAIWAGFIHMVRDDPKMRATHERTYFQFRDQLQILIDAALREAGRAADPATLRRLAIACNAVIDGLWLEGGALPEAFAEHELSEIGRHSVGAILGMTLIEKEVEA